MKIILLRPNRQDDQELSKCPNVRKTNEQERERVNYTYASHDNKKKIENNEKDDKYYLRLSQKVETDPWRVPGLV